MEQFPGNNRAHEQSHELARPVLSLDLAGEQGNIFVVIGYARQLLPPDEQELLRQELQTATAPGAGKKYDDILKIVHTHVELVDISETHAVYGNPEHVQDATERYQRHIIAAVDKLNTQIQTLPETTSVQIDGVYPEFDSPDYSPGRYMVLLNFEIGNVEAAIEQRGVKEREALERYRVMLRECRSALRQAGVI